MMDGSFLFLVEAFVRATHTPSGVDHWFRKIFDQLETDFLSLSELEALPSPPLNVAFIGLW